jgi:hypothetical protein
MISELQAARVIKLRGGIGRRKIKYAMMGDGSPNNIKSEN